MPWDDIDERRGQQTWDDYFLGPGRENEPPTTPPGSDATGGGPQTYRPPTGGDGEDPTGNWAFSGVPEFQDPGLNFNFGAAPRFQAPRFTAPTAESVLNEPGYKFGLDEGERALQQSAAGKGVLRTGGTLKDITSWGQNYAGQKYGDAFNRALSSFDRLYQGDLDMYKPRLTEWQTLAAAQQRAQELQYQRAWDRYTFGVDDTFRREDADRRFFNDIGADDGSDVSGF